jgi:two-component system response regulator HydG
MSETFRGRVLVVEDEGYVRRSIADLLRARGFEVEAVDGVPASLDLLGRTTLDVVLTDLMMPGGGGLAVVRAVRDRDAGLPVVVLTGHGTIASAVECLKAGATDYLLKPIEPEALDVALDQAIGAGALRREVDYLRGGGGGPDDPHQPIGRSAVWVKVLERARAAAASHAAVLLLGESGTGKELIARLIHRQSPRASGPYVQVNCAAVPIDIWESEFFGHRRGAFTGAAADRDGRFRLAHRGTLFMDEIGAMAPPAQAKILRVLQDGEFDRLGDERPTRVDVRAIAATNSDLDADVAAGRFRQDLFFRLNVVRIKLPPLRQRPEDIPLIAERFLRRCAARLGRPVPEVAPAAIDALLKYSWPGNVRELQNVIERTLILRPGPVLDLFDLPDPDPGVGPDMAEPPGPPDPRAPADTTLLLRVVLARLERETILEALKRARGVRKEAARLLGVDQRNLAYYFRKHDLDPD